MKTYIKIEIEKDYNSDLSYDLRNENLSYLLSELSIYCEIANKRFINIVEDFNPTTTYKEDYKNTIQIEATGYSQDEWQEYHIYYNNDEVNKELLNQLKDLLSKTFTHQNDYRVTKYEEEIINNKVFKSEPIDYTTFCINYIEFPSEEEVIKEYQNWYGIDYDKVEININ